MRGLNDQEVSIQLEIAFESERTSPVMKTFSVSLVKLFATLWPTL
jgi:hypothetical protein